MQRDAVVASDLGKAYGRVDAVDGISFAVRTGECFGFLGVNGAGKTTTVKMIHCGCPPTTGSLQVLGKDVRKESRAIKEELGVLPQEDNLDPDLRVRESLLVYARYFNLGGSAAKQRADELLQFVQLGERARSPVTQLSGGMKRRLVLARALINRPRLILLDEPTTGLDPQARHLVWSRLRRLRAAGVTMVLTTHYMEEAAQLCNRVGILDRGRLLAIGEPDSLVRQHVGNECIEFRPRTGSRAEIRQRLGEADCAWEEAGDTLFIYPKSTLPLDSLRDVPHERLLHRPATLEDLFLRLTGRELRE